MESFGVRRGKRVVIRARVTSETHRFTDYLGTIETWETDSDTEKLLCVTLLTRSGQVRVLAADIVAIKEVPAPPQRPQRGTKDGPA